MSIAFLFPGQGSQFPGMLHQLLDHPEVVRNPGEGERDSGMIPNANPG
jgi:malonate decarboxylase epsilon subunit